MPRHNLTPDYRRRGQAKGAETKRARREEAEEHARSKLADAAGEAVETPFLAAGVGFEPTGDLSAAYGFQDRPVRPLRHPAEGLSVARRLA
jgi:hypothetical protein